MVANTGFGQPIRAINEIKNKRKIFVIMEFLRAVDAIGVKNFNVDEWCQRNWKFREFLTIFEFIFENLKNVCSIDITDFEFCFFSFGKTLGSQANFGKILCIFDE